MNRPLQIGDVTLISKIELFYSFVQQNGEQYLNTILYAMVWLFLQSNFSNDKFQRSKIL